MGLMNKGIVNLNTLAHLQEGADKKGFPDWHFLWQFPEFERRRDGGGEVVVEEERRTVPTREQISSRIQERLKSESPQDERASEVILTGAKVRVPPGVPTEVGRTQSSGSDAWPWKVISAVLFVALIVSYLPFFRSTPSIVMREPAKISPVSEGTERSGRTGVTWPAGRPAEQTGQPVGRIPDPPAPPPREAVVEKPVSTAEADAERIAADRIRAERDEERARENATEVFEEPSGPE